MKIFRIIIFLIIALESSIPVIAQSAETYFNYGYTALMNNQFEEGRTCLEKAAQLGETKAYGILAMSYLLLKKGDYENARHWAKKGVSFEDPLSYQILAWTNCNTATSISDFTSNLSLLLSAFSKIETARLANLIGTCYLLTGDTKSCKTWIQKACTLSESKKDNDYYWAQAILAKALMVEKQYVEAITVATKALDNGNPLANYVMGRCQIKLDIYPEAGKERIIQAWTHKYGVMEIPIYQLEIIKYAQSIK